MNKASTIHKEDGSFHHSSSSFLPLPSRYESTLSFVLVTLAVVLCSCHNPFPCWRCFRFIYSPHRQTSLQPLQPCSELEGAVLREELGSSRFDAKQLDWIRVCSTRLSSSFVVS